MILGQLIQTGRQFCECRSAEFIPESEEQLVVVAYTITDRLIARSLDANDPRDRDKTRRWLQSSGAIGYIVIARHPKNHQPELPSPIGLPLMDAVTIASVASRGCAATTYLLERRSDSRSCRLIRGVAANPLRYSMPLDLLDAADEEPKKPDYTSREEEALLSF